MNLKLLAKHKDPCYSLILNKSSAKQKRLSVTPHMSSVTTLTWCHQEFLLDILHLKQREGSLVLFQKPSDLWTAAVQEMVSLPSIWLIQACLKDIKTWTCNFLLLNSDKTEVIVLGRKHLRNTWSNNTTTLDGITLASSSIIRNLAVIYLGHFSYCCHKVLLMEEWWVSVNERIQSWSALYDCYI